MRFSKLMVLCTFVFFGGCTHLAKDKSPPSQTVGSQTYYDTQVVTGNCVGSTEAGVFGAGIAAAFIKQGVNEFGTALALAASGFNDMAPAQTLMETNQEGFGKCIYVIRGWFYREAANLNKTQDAKGLGYPSALATGQSYLDLGLFIAARPDFFFQGQIIQSMDGSKNFIKPVSAVLNTPIKTITARTEKRDVEILFAFGAQSVDIRTAPGTKVSLGDLKQNIEVKFPKDACRSWSDGKIQTPGCPSVNNYDDTMLALLGKPKPTLAAGLPTPRIAKSVTLMPPVSGWFAVQINKQTLSPIVLQAGVIETLGPSPVLKFVSSVFTSKEDDITTAIQNRVIPSYSDTAKLTDRKAQDALSKSYNASLKDAKTAVLACAKSTATSDDRRDAGDKLRAFRYDALAADRDAGGVADGGITMVESSNGGSICEAYSKLPIFQ
jgi:hypothetical protein